MVPVVLSKICFHSFTVCFVKKELITGEGAVPMQKFGVHLGVHNISLNWSSTIFMSLNITLQL